MSQWVKAIWPISSPDNCLMNASSCKMMLSVFQDESSLFYQHGITLFTFALWEDCCLLLCFFRIYDNMRICKTKIYSWYENRRCVCYRNNSNGIYRYGKMTGHVRICWWLPVFEICNKDIFENQILCVHILRSLWIVPALINFALS